jgi:hypothetical protein
MKRVRLRLISLALLMFLSAVLVPERSLGQRGGARVTRPDPGSAPSPGRPKLKPNEILVTRLKVEPAKVEFYIYKDFKSDTKSIEITDQDQSNEWVFVRLKPWPKHLQFKVGSSANSQTLEKDQPLPADQWIGFKNKITLNVTLGEEDAAGPGTVALIFENGSVELTDVSRESATKAVSAGVIKPTGTEQMEITWQPFVVSPPDDSDKVLKVLLWILGITVVVVVLVVVLKLNQDRFRAWFDRRRYAGNRAKRVNGAGHGSGGGGERERVPEAPRLNLTQLKSELEATKKEFLAEVNKLIGESVKYLDEGQNSVNVRLNGLETTLHSLTSLKSELSAPIDEAIEKAHSGFGKVDRKFEELRDTMAKGAENLLTRQKQFEEARLEVIAKRVEQARRTERQLIELREQLERQTEPDVTYSHMLGELFGKSISLSGEDNFRELGEAVNDFFSHQVPAPDDNLLKLKERGQAIGSSVEALLVKVRQANGVVDSDLGKHVERVRQIIAEFDAFYCQLSDRQLDLFVTNLRIPVAIHAGARDSFLDELGAALKREIEKLRQPAAYFERQFRQLATSEIVAITDICDKTVKPSLGLNLGLEADLEALFEPAGLKSILPAPMEDFQSSCQDLVEVVTALEPGLNRKIARVISRGFSYQEDNRQDLLRKAAVVIYG